MTIFPADHGFAVMMFHAALILHALVIPAAMYIWLDRRARKPRLAGIAELRAQTATIRRRLAANR